MRTSNSKVSGLLYAVNFAYHLQKIDSLKNQLTTMADLIKDPLTENDEKGLDEDEHKILRESGILQTPNNRKRRKTSHIVFADSKEEGIDHLVTSL
jgi:U3 small nucleolar RNA-associated protein 11